MAQLSDFIRSPLPSFTAGEILSKNDLLELYSDGAVYRCRNSDFAAQANTGSVLTATAGASDTSGAALISPTSKFSTAILRTSDGSIYQFESTGGGAVIDKYTATYTKIGSVNPDTSAHTMLGQLYLLSNGNILLIFQDNSVTTNSSYYIYTPQLIQVTGTTFGVSVSYGAIALSGGGFAVGTATPAVLIKDNTGTTVATITPGGAPTSITQLSSGDILITYNNGGTTFFGVWSVTGTVVVAATTSTVAQSTVLDVSIMSGFFAIAFTSSVCAVFNNALVKQGATITKAAVSSVTRRPIHNDGTQFYFITGSGTSTCNVTVITTAGANTLLTMGVFAAAQVGPWDVIFLSGNIVVISNNSATVPTVAQFLIYNAKIGAVVSAPATFFSNSIFDVGVGGISFAEDSVVFMYGSASGAITITLTAGYKFLNTAIVGVATAAATLGASVVVDPTLGYKAINAVGGSLTKAFDHSATNIHGNKGTIVNTVVALQGI